MQKAKKLTALLLSLTMLLALAACGSGKTGETAVPAPAETAATPAPPAEIPVGDCGDQSALAPDQRVANTARWTTASEQDSFGFDVFRGDSEDGEFTKLTAEPILGAGTSDETHKYEFRDDTIDPCKAYWYYVEGISTSGKHERFTPVFRAPPKRRAADAAAPAATE